MTSRTKPIPEGYHHATPYLCVKNAASAIEFYKQAFGAMETARLTGPDGKIGHAEIEIGDAPIMLADEHLEFNFLSPQSLGGSPVIIHLFVEDVDALVRQAVAAGARVLRPAEDQFYGDRRCELSDPFGHVWNFATHKEDVKPEEMQKRFEAYMKQQGGSNGLTTESARGSVKPAREGFHTVTPYLMVQKAAELVDFVKQAFGATKTLRTTGSAGGMHAEVKIGDSMIMIGGGGTWSGEPIPAAIYLYMEEVDTVYQRALQAGGASIIEPADQSYGDRMAGVKDPFGNVWYIATHKKNVQL